MFEITQLTLTIQIITAIIMLSTIFIVEKIRTSKQKTKFRWKNIIISIVSGALLFLVFAEPIYIIKYFIFTQIMLYASNQDYNSHEVDDYIHPMICLTGLIGFSYYNAITMFAGAVAIFIIEMIVFMVCKGNFMGGADVKFTTACGFLLGLQRGFIGLIIGLLLSVIVNMIIRKVKKLDKNTPFTLVPYLSIGMFAGIFMLY